MTVTHCHATCMDVIFELSPTSRSSSCHSAPHRDKNQGVMLNSVGCAVSFSDRDLFRVLFVSVGRAVFFLFFFAFSLSLSLPSTLALPHSCREYYHVSFVTVTVSHTLFLFFPFNTVTPPSFHTHDCKFRVKLQCSKKAWERKNSCILSWRVKSLATDSGYLGVAWIARGRGDGGWAKKEKNKKIFGYLAQQKTQPGPDGPKASGWYGRLRGPISPLSLIHSDQL